MLHDLHAPVRSRRSERHLECRESELSFNFALVPLGLSCGQNSELILQSLRFYCMECWHFNVKGPKCALFAIGRCRVRLSMQASASLRFSSECSCPRAFRSTTGASAAWLRVVRCVEGWGIPGCACTACMKTGYSLMMVQEKVSKTVAPCLV